VTVQVGLALLALAGLVVGVALLIRSACPGLRVLGWTMAVVLLLFGGLIVLTQGSHRSFAPDHFMPQDKFPDGGLEVGFVVGQKAHATTASPRSS
jgi:hypothetical protein